jgi:hypothetical protein
MNDDSTAAENNETNITNDPFEWNCYTFYRSPVLINKKITGNDGKSTILGSCGHDGDKTMTDKIIIAIKIESILFTRTFVGPALYKILIHLFYR